MFLVRNRSQSEAGRIRACLLLALLLVPAAGSQAVPARHSTPDPHAILQRMARSYDGIYDYTALFLKRERINGTLQPLEKIDLRFQEPFKLYMAWREPYAGRKIAYIEGEHDNKIRVNPGGMLRFLRLSLDPASPLVTRNSHHSVRKAGLRNTIKLIMEQYRKGQKRNEVTLTFRGFETLAGRPTYRLEFVCTAPQSAGYYARRGEIWIDQENHLPIRLDVYDWNDQLYASYEYRNLHLNPGLPPEAFVLDAVKPAPTRINLETSGP